MNTPAKSNARPFKVTENGRTLASAATPRGAQIAVARRIGADVEGRTLIIDGPDGRIVCTNQGLSIACDPEGQEGATAARRAQMDAHNARVRAERQAS